MTLAHPLPTLVLQVRRLLSGATAEQHLWQDLVSNKCETEGAYLQWGLRTTGWQPTKPGLDVPKFAVAPFRLPAMHRAA